MNKEQLTEFAADIIGEPVKILLQTVGGKWYEAKYSEDFTEINPSKVYGILFNDMIQFDFKTGKNPDTFFQSFVNQYISKVAVKAYRVINGELVKPTKAQVLTELQTSDRVRKYLFYTTLYGIGFFCFLMNEKAFAAAKELLSTYLQSKGISFRNEYSDAMWVYRYVIGQKIEAHNQLLNDFEI